VTKSRLMGVPCMVPTGWLDHPLRTTRCVRKGLLEGRLMGWMNKFTLLDDATRGFGGAGAGRWGGEASRRQRLIGVHDPGGDRRLLFGAGAAEAGAGAKQERIGARPEICTTTSSNLVFLRKFWKGYHISDANQKNYVSRRGAGTQSRREGCGSLISAPPRLCARRFWLRPEAALGQFCVSRYW
jgi:hypothetical protein